MEFKHFIHPEHNLSFIEVGKKDDSLCCYGCLDIIHGPAYICTSPGHEYFGMHKSCAELPSEIQRDAFHPHPLRFNYMLDVFACDGCATLWAGDISYRCMYCAFNLDFKCAVSISNDYELPCRKALHEGRRIKTTIHHFSHHHQLTRCKFPLFTTWFGEEIFQSSWGSGKSKCMACKEQLHDTLIYACIPCRFALHESCVNDMPTQVLQSPFHPQHILFPRWMRKGSSHRCSACRDEVAGISFYCNRCDANLHVCCAMYRTRAIKHNCHPHYLLQLGKSIKSIKVSCKACDEDCSDSFFSCMKCDFDIHVGCIPLPPSAQNTRHLHPLMLVNPFVEDDSGEHYCDMCEKKRNGEHHVYYCEECKFIAHIGCAIFEIEATKEMFLDQGIEDNSDKADEIMNDNRIELERILVHDEKKIQKVAFHPHPLTLREVDEDALFVCNGCGELRHGFSYNCSQCMFRLDIRCAALNDDLAIRVAKKGREIQTTIHHFSHNHQLTRCKIPKRLIPCMACKQGAYGLVYVCLHCPFILHEPCLKDMPMQILGSPFHPQHPLLPYQSYVGMKVRPCDTCQEDICRLMFTCFQCQVIQHYSCAKYQTRKIKHNCHDHHLLHLGKSIFVKKSPLCNACGEGCSDTLFSCTDCKFHIHLECIPLPSKVKHKRHLHPLTLTNSIVEDNSAEYYCDPCETTRNREHDVYYCKECTFTAHIDCVLSEVEPPEEIVEYLVPRQKWRTIKEIDEGS